MLLLPETGLHPATLVAERLRATLAETPIRVAEYELRVTISIGVATSLADHSIHELLKYADKALYEAKRTGRNRVCRREVTPANADVPHGNTRYL